MDLKFIVLALVISVAAGATGKEVESPLLKTSNIPIDTNKNEELVDASTAKNTEKPLHDVKTVLRMSEFDLPRNPATDIDLSTEDKTKHFTNDNNTTTTSTTTAKSTTTTTTSTTTTAPASTTTTTTPHPTTTTTTTANPPVPPAPEEGKWVVNDSKIVCIVLQTEIEFNITYPGNKDSVYNKTIYINKNANASGDCGKSVEYIVLKWDLGNLFNVSFKLNETGKFQVDSLSLTLNTTGFKNIRDNTPNITYVLNKPDFPVIPLKMSYKCDKQLKQILQSSDKYNATLLISHTQFEAFTNNKTAFGAAKDCAEFDTPDIVPIAVGCVLSILVLVVLVAYLIGRRRSQSRGYLSM